MPWQPRWQPPSWAPWQIGSAADFLVLGSLASYVLAFAGYLFAPSASVLILIRGAAGAFTAGLIPAATGMVADLAPSDRRAQWIGFLNGGSSVGWILGPVIGGVLYDHWGYEAAVGVSTIIAVATFVLALLALPETRTARDQSASLALAGSSAARRQQGLSPASFRGTLPGQLSTFLIMLSVVFAAMLAWAFIEPRFMFYAYDELHWSSSMLGAVMGAYGMAMMLGEFGLGRLSDRLGRKPVIVVGLILFVAQFLGLAFLHDYIWIAATFVIAGLGNALYDPALSASILDVAPAEHRAAVMGFKSTASSMGSILGPALMVLFASVLSAESIFFGAAIIVGLTILLVLTVRGRRAQADRVGTLVVEDGLH